MNRRKSCVFLIQFVSTLCISFSLFFVCFLLFLYIKNCSFFGRYKNILCFPFFYFFLFFFGILKFWFFICVCISDAFIRPQLVILKLSYYLFYISIQVLLLANPISSKFNFVIFFFFGICSGSNPFLISFDFYLSPLCWSSVFYFLLFCRSSKFLSILLTIQPQYPRSVAHVYSYSRKPTMSSANCCNRPLKSANSGSSKPTASSSSSTLSKSKATKCSKVSLIHSDLCLCAQETRCSCGARPARQCTCSRATCENLMVPTQTCSCGMRQAYHCTCSRASIENMGSLREGEIDFTYLR